MGPFGIAVETFGAFLIPAVLFVVGVVFYVVLWWLGRVAGDGDPGGEPN